VGRRDQRAIAKRLRRCASRALPRAGSPYRVGSLPTSQHAAEPGQGGDQQRQTMVRDSSAAGSAFR
jgi:hypothetical protein